LIFKRAEGEKKGIWKYPLLNKFFYIYCYFTVAKNMNALKKKKKQQNDYFKTYYDALLNN
jgi:hypothetical protein